MANFHNKLVLNKYMLSLFGIDSIGKKSWASPYFVEDILFPLKTMPHSRYHALQVGFTEVRT